MENIFCGTAPLSEKLDKILSPYLIDLAREFWNE